jgi:hypothetical protein
VTLRPPGRATVWMEQPGHSLLTQPSRHHPSNKPACRSEQRDGFDPAKLGMSEATAADLALRFSQYDLNDDGRLDAGEVRLMAGQLGVELSADEAKAAIQVCTRARACVR